MGPIVIRTRYDEGTESAEVATSDKTGIKEVDSFLLTVQICFYTTTEILHDIINLFLYLYDHKNFNQAKRYCLAKEALLYLILF